MESPTPEQMRDVFVSIFDGNFIPALSWEDMTDDEKKLQKEKAIEALRNKTLLNEIDKLINAAGRTVIRKTKTDEETAWHRGGVHYLDTLRERLKFLSTLDKFDGV